MSTGRSYSSVDTLREDERLHFLEEALAKMKKEGVLDPNLNLKVIAARTQSYDRGELELLVKLAQGSCFSEYWLGGGNPNEFKGVKLRMEDFIVAFGDMIRYAPRS